MDSTREHDQDSPERFPLLERREALDADADANSETVTIAPRQDRYLQIRFIVLCMIVIILIELGAFLQAIPLNKVLEEIICRNFHPQLPIIAGDDEYEALCKDTAVQGELALIRGGQVTFGCIPSILTAIPYGFAADKYGRKPILLLGILGFVLSSFATVIICWWPNIFPVRLIWAVSLFYFIGGGVTVFVAMIFVIVSDIFSEEQRSTMFSYLGAATLVGEIIGSSSASAAMNRDPWFAILLGVGCVCFCGCIVPLFPETLNYQSSKVVLPDQPSDAEGRGAVISVFREAKESICRLGTDEFWYIWSSKHLVLLLFTFLVTTLGRQFQELLLQYVTMRYHWSWARAGFLLSLRALCSAIILVIVLPSCSYILTNRLSISALRRDLWLSRVSATVIVIGSLGIGFAGTPALMILGLVIMSLGAGYNLLTRSLFTSLIEPRHVGIMYNTIGLLETIGSIVAGPLMAGSFRAGLDLGGGWIGLPFWIAAALFACASVVVWVVKFPARSTFKPHSGLGDDADAD